MGKKKSKDILEFKRIKKYKKYTNNGEFKLSRIYLNGVKTNYIVREDGKIFSSYTKEGELKELKIPQLQKNKFYKTKAYFSFFIPP